MDLLAKKKRAAAIAVSCYLQQMEEEVQPTNEKAWRNAGIQRIILGKEVLFRRGRLVGQKNL
ncbi:MAG: hypothetical protein COB60_07825 [Flavobacteriaceae bacterium]|nr:MAG: hypothetical protein COB60_07825 [Flavobacteriaceae bacterium]